MLLRGGSVLSLNPVRFEPTDLRIESDTILQRGPRLRPKPGETVVNCASTLIVAGQVCAHTHSYSALARGMTPPSVPPRSFPDILKRIWWKLDCALTPAAIRASAMMAALDAVRSGTTTIVDHHASPRAIDGSLDIIRDAFATVGVRGVLAYEVSDRGGRPRRDQGLAENDRFLRQTSHDPMFRGLVGAHASFTLGDDTLERLADLVRTHRTGIHVHVAEALDDVRKTAATYGCAIVDRLARAGVLNRNAVLAHGVHLSETDIRQVRKSGAWLVHNPRSNMNNGVGHAPVHRFGPRACLGTDGWLPDVWVEAQSAYFRLRERLGPASAIDPTQWLQANQRLASNIFGIPFGALTPGSPADLVICDYAAPTPVTADNVAWHLLFAWRPTMIRRVMVAGRWIMVDGALPHIDVAAETARARSEASALWKRMARLSSATGTR